MTFQTLISQESLRHPIIDHLRVILTAWEPGLKFTMQRAPGRRPVRDRLLVDANDGGGPLEIRRIRVRCHGREYPSALVTRSVDVNGHRALRSSEVVDAIGYRASSSSEAVAAAGGEAAGRGCVVAAAGGEAAGRGCVVAAAGGEAAAQPNYFAAVARLTGLVDVATLSQLCPEVVWAAIEKYRQHARQVLLEAFPNASFLRLCFRRSIKEIELSWDLPTSLSVTYDCLLEALYCSFPASAVRTLPKDWAVVVEAPLADLKFYCKENPKGLPHNLIRCEAVLRNYRNGQTPRYRKQIVRALRRFSRRHRDGLIPTGVQFSSSVALQCRVEALAAFVAEEYLSRLCDHSLDHSTADRLQATERAMAQASESFQHRSIRKVVALLGQYRGQVPTSKVHWKLKKRLIAESILERRKWGRAVYLTVGSAVNRQLGIFDDVGIDDPNPKPYLDGHRITGWAHRVAMSVNVA